MNTLSAFLFPLHGRCSVKLAVQDKKILPLGHEKEQIYVQAVFPYFGRREPESIMKKGIRSVLFRWEII